MEKNNEKDLINYQKDEKNFDLKVNKIKKEKIVLINYYH